MAKSILIFFISNFKKERHELNLGLLIVAIHEVGMDRTGMTARHLKLVSRLSRFSVTEVVQETNP